MTREQIESYIEKKHDVFEKNLEKFLETGERRYERTYQQAKDEIDIAKLALSALSGKQAEKSSMAARAESWW